MKFLQIWANGHVYVNNLLKQYQEANATSICNVYMNFYNGLRVVQTYETDLLKINWDYDTWKQRFPENRYYWVDTSSFKELVPDPEIGAVFFRLYEDGERTGILLVGIKKEFFDNILDVESYGTDAGVCLLTEEGCMSFGDKKATEFISKMQEELLPKLRRSVHSELLGDYYVIGSSMDITNWKLVYAVEDDSISNAHNVMREILIITLAVVIIVSVLIHLLSQRMSRSMRELTRRVQQQNVLGQEFSVQGYAEINFLNDGLEKMRCRIKRLLNQIEHEQEEKRKIEIALMQEQVNPHFLYNTLNAIMQLCEMNQTKEASKMLDALSSFYRIGLSKGKNNITVQEELEHVENYLLLQHFRYPDLFDYVIDCDPQILQCRIPKMSLQPLVENAIYHGIRMHHGRGNICIVGGTHDGENAYLEVRDDGAGISPEVLNEIRAALELGEDNRVFGMRNVDSRIKMEFGADMGIKIHQTPTDTCVSIHFRMEELEDERL